MDKDGEEGAGEASRDGDEEPTSPFSPDGFWGHVFLGPQSLSPSSFTGQSFLIVSPDATEAMLPVHFTHILRIHLSPNLTPAFFNVVVVCFEGKPTKNGARNRGSRRNGRGRGSGRDLLENRSISVRPGIRISGFRRQFVGSAASQLHVFRRRCRLFLRGFRSEVGADPQLPGTAGCFRGGFGQKRSPELGSWPISGQGPLTNRPISGRPANLRASAQNEGNPEIRRQSVRRRGNSAAIRNSGSAALRCRVFRRRRRLF